MRYDSELKAAYPGPYKGFLMIKCEKCGKVKGFCAKRDLYEFRCECGSETQIENLIPMYMNCPNCGGRFKYRTNIRDKKLTRKCLSCDSPIDLILNKNETAYTTEGDRPPRGR